MAKLDELSPGQILADASVAQFIQAMGVSIAEAQKQLDLNSLAQVAEYTAPREGLAGKSLLQLGLSPPFYHYQHADLTVSMQLLMKVGNSETFGIGGKIEYGFDKGSGGSSAGKARQAQIKLSKLPASVSVDGKKLDATGDDLESAGEALAKLLRKPEGAFDLALVDSPSKSIGVERVPPTATNPVLTPGAVAFLPTGARDSALLRISTTPTAGQSLDFVLDASTTVTVPAGADARDFASKVQQAIDAETGYKARLVSETGTGAPSAPGALAIALFDTGQDKLLPAALSELEKFAQTMSGALSRPLAVFGYADVRGSTDDNLKLGKRRAASVAAHLRHLKFTDVTETDATDLGEARWTGTGTPANNAQFRRAEVRDRNGSAHYIAIEAEGSTRLQETPTPDKTAADATGDGFVVVSRAAALPVDATQLKLITPATSFDLSGAAVNTGTENLAVDSPQAHAFNLAKAINAKSADTKVRATRRGSVVVLASTDDAVLIDLVLLGSKAVELKAENGASISKPLPATTDSSAAADKPADQTKRTFAIGASVDFRTSRMFETSVNGNSSISARLVSVPAPVEFLDEIRKFLAPAETPTPTPTPTPGPTP